MVDLALVLFGGNYNWFIRQDNNGLILDHNYAFLIDTVRYIATGKRRLSIHTWPMLLTAEPPAGLHLIEERKEIAVLFQTLALNTGTHAMLQRWLSHKGGFDDMMYTMNMLFGTVPTKVD
ncbi:hypothetical protein D3C78_1465350 [compost metagenome]